MSISETYRENEILSAAPLELVRILSESTLEAVRAARRHLGEGDIKGRSRQINRASSILNELAICLDHSNGGALSRQLAELYSYMQQQLVEANFRQIDAPLAEVERLLLPLLDAWDGVSAGSVGAQSKCFDYCY